MNIQLIEALAKNFQQGDNRLSYDLALTEAILNQAIIELDSKGKIPSNKIVDKSKR
jgi:hypothetical protein